MPLLYELIYGLKPELAGGRDTGASFDHSGAAGQTFNDRDM